MLVVLIGCVLVVFWLIGCVGWLVGWLVGCVDWLYVGFVGWLAGCVDWLLG